MPFSLGSYKLSVLHGGPILASTASYMFAKFDLTWGTIFGKGGPLLAADIGPGGPIFGGIDFGVTGLATSNLYTEYSKNSFVRSDKI